VSCAAFEACPSDLRYRLNPTAQTIGVGETFKATAEFLGCAGTKHLDDSITWEAADSNIARVDPMTGQVTGRSPGLTQVRATGARYGLMPPIAVTVQ